MPNREKWADQGLYVANAQATINSFVGVSEFTLDELIAWFRGELRQPGLQGRAFDTADLYSFVRHLQLTDQLGFIPTDDEYPEWIINQIPIPCPPMPSGAWATTSGVSCTYETGWPDYVLYSDESDGNGVQFRVNGVIRGDESGVDFGYTPEIGERCWFMVQAGVFFSFANEVTVAS